MPNLDYVVTSANLMRDLPNKVARWAVLKRLQAPGPRGVPVFKAYAKAHTCWQRRVYALQGAGWSPLNPDPTPGPDGEPRSHGDAARLAAGYLCNCPPVGVFIEGSRMRPCKRVRVCPWCWGRMVRDAAQAVLWALQLLGKRADACQLCAARLLVSNCNPLGTYLPRRAAGGRFDPTYMRDSMWIDYHGLKKASPVLGARLLCTLLPGTEPGKVSFLRAGIFLLPADAKHVVAVPHMTVKYAPAVPASLEPLLVKAFAYPMELLFGDSGQMVEILHATAAMRLHMTKSVGVLDSAQFRDMLAPGTKGAGDGQAED